MGIKRCTTNLKQEAVLLNYIDTWINCYLYVKDKQRTRIKERARELLKGGEYKDIVRQNKY